VHEPRIVAIVPMRHDSERVKGKNYRPLGGRPLYHHIVSTLRACPRITAVVIDTDSDLIAADAKASFADVEVIMRPEAIRGGEVAMNIVLLNDVAQVPADVYVQTHSTNPLLGVDTVTRAIDAYLDAQDRCDSLFTVTALQTRLYTAGGVAMNHDPALLLRTQDLEPVMEENSCLYVFSSKSLRRAGNRIGEDPLLFAIDREEAWDIDDETDWKVVEALYAARHP
jgi:CMP-N-acetylneuraminic acid synthetase